MRPQIFVTNVFPDDNKGGAAITAATIEAIERSVRDSHITLIANQVTDDHVERSHRFTVQRFPDARLTMPLLRLTNGKLAGIRAVLASLVMLIRDPRKSSLDVVRQLAGAQLVVSKGGYVFVERHSIRRLLSNWLTVFPLVLAARARVRTAAIGATIGPFQTWHSRALNRWVLRTLDLVVPRDEYSYREALSLGLPAEKVVLMPDLVFAHRGPPDGLSEQVVRRYELGAARIGAVTLAEGPRNRAFGSSLHACFVRLLDAGVVDKVLVVVQSLQDLDISREFVAACGDDRIVLIEDDLSPDELMALYGVARFVVARRMHSAIFALIAGTPALAFTKHGKKVQGVMRSLNLEDFVLSYPRIDADELHERIIDLLADEQATRERVHQAVENARSKLAGLSPLLRRLIARPAVDRTRVKGSVPAHVR